MNPSERQPVLRTGPWILLGLIGILLLFGGLGTWAATSQIAGAIVASGTLGVESKIKTVQHLEGGIVGKILVRNGDHVKAGQLLIRLDDTTIRANHAIVEGRLNELDATLARLRAERDGLDKITFPERLLKKKSRPAVKAMMRGQTSLFTVRRKSKAGQVRILRQRAVQLEEQIKGLEIQKTARQEQIEIIDRSIRRKNKAASAGLISGDTMDTIRRQKARLTGEVGDLVARIAQARGSIEEIRQQILQVDKDFREKVLSEISRTHTEMSELQEKESALDEQLRRIDIRAPQAGRIHNMSIFTVGGVISPAKPILQIIPENDRLIIEARISPTDIDQVKISQQAAIHLSAFDARTTPVLEGTVSKISAAQVVDPNSGHSFFTVEVEIPPEQRQLLRKDQKLLPGMPAELFIRTGERTPLEYFLKPMMEQIQRAFKEQ